MSKIILTIALILSGTTFLQAYPIYGFQVGMNINQLRAIVNNELTQEYSYGSNYNAGIFYRTGGRKFRLQTSLLYNPKGAKDLTSVPLPVRERKFRLDYLTLSAPFLYNVNSEGLKNWTLSMGAGPYVSRMVSAVAIDRTAVKSETVKQKVTIGNDPGDGVKAMDVGLTFYLSYKLNRFAFSANYDMGFTNISNTPNRIVRNRTFALNMGIFVQPQGRKRNEKR